MRLHFWHQNARDTVVVLEEGNRPNPRCPLCDMLFPWRDLIGAYKRTAQFKRGSERKRQILAVEE